MDEMIKSMVELMQKTGSGYVKVGFGEYSIFVTDNETAEFIENALDEEEVE